MYCKECGNKLEENASFCSECGAQFQNNASSPVKKKTNRKIIILSIVVCIVILAGVFITKIIPQMPMSESDLKEILLANVEEKYDVEIREADITIDERVTDEGHDYIEFSIRYTTDNAEYYQKYQMSFWYLDEAWQMNGFEDYDTDSWTSTPTNIPTAEEKLQDSQNYFKRQMCDDSSVYRLENFAVKDEQSEYDEEEQKILLSYTATYKTPVFKADIDLDRIYRYDLSREEWLEVGYNSSEYYNFKSNIARNWSGVANQYWSDTGCLFSITEENDGKITVVLCFDDVNLTLVGEITKYPESKSPYYEFEVSCENDTTHTLTGTIYNNGDISAEYEEYYSSSICLYRTDISLELAD